MVVFTCGHCGESVNKPKVEKHYLTKCKNRNPNLSCMDCFKDFLGKDYETHTKCITEEERYSGKGFQAKEKKGEKKQNAWVEMLQSVLDEQKTASKNVLRIIETISKHNNTPRKKPKFFNFVKNVCGSKTSPKDIDQAWDLISVKLSALSNNNRDNLKDTSNISNGESKDVEPEKDDILTEGNAKDKENQEESNEIADKDKESERQVNGDTSIKLSKKQRKEEKKRRKYEVELQQVEAGLDETEETAEVSNKTKKNKNKPIGNGHSDAVNGELKGKNKKRKRQDTVNTIESVGKEVVIAENDVTKVKATKKKPKTDGEDEANESLCLHDQNVAQSEITTTNGKFNWHAVIVSVLQKKGNEVPFKRLQKKVLTEYTEFTGSEVDDRIADKFIKKLKSAPNVKVDKNKVILIEE